MTEEYYWQRGKHHMYRNMFKIQEVLFKDLSCEHHIYLFSISMYQVTTHLVASNSTDISSHSFCGSQVWAALAGFSVQVLTRLQSRWRPGLRILWKVHMVVDRIHVPAAGELTEAISSRPAGAGTSLSVKGLTWLGCIYSSTQDNLHLMKYGLTY